MPPKSARNVHPAQSAPKRKLPPWYYRLVALTIDQDRDVEPEDFDEDLSDLEEPKEDAKSSSNSMHGSCKCDNEDSECDGDCQDDYMDDSLSQRSYDGSDADFYYELKHDREERKYELQDMRETEQQERKGCRDFEHQAEKEIEEAFKHLQQAFRQGDAPSILELHPSKLFHLYSVDHVDHCHDPFLYPTKYIEFYSLDDDGELVDDKQMQLSGHVYFDVNTGCDIADFSPPEYTSLEEHMLKIYDGELEVGCRFISNDYIIVTVPRELVLMGNPTIPSAPERFKFMGIRHDHEKERQRRERARPRSPRESWFDLNHSW